MTDAEKTEALAVHPAAGLLPMMPPSKLKLLAADIKANGLREPITLYEGNVLDGRNRLAACAIAGVEPQFRDAALNGSSPTLHAVSLNLPRHNLKVGQSAAVGALMLPLLAKERGMPGKRGRPPVNGFHGNTRVMVAEVVGASSTTIQRAQFIKSRDPELFQRILAGEIAVEAALKEVKGIATPRKAPAFPTGKRGEIMRQYARRRMIETISQIRGMCRGVAEMNLPVIASTLTTAESKAFVASGFEISRVMRVFAMELREAGK